MKQGSGDDPFASEAADAGGDEADSSDTPADTDPAGAERESTTPARTQERSLPYIHSRDGVKDGRTQRPVFLRDHIEDGIDDLVTRMEDEFGEAVYKTDITEAAMAVAQENPELVREKLDQWGYGWA